MNFEQVLRALRKTLWHVPESRSLLVHRGCVVSAVIPELVLINILVVQDLVHDTRKGNAGVELDPRGRKHEIDVALVLVGPKLDDSAEIELADHLV